MTDQEDVVGCFESDSFHSEPFQEDLIVQNGYYFGSEDTVCVADEGANLTGRYQPVEEPWLLDQFELSHYATEDLNASNDLTGGNGVLEFLPIGRSESELSSESIRYSADSYSESEKVDHQFNIESISGWRSFSDRNHPVEDPWLMYPSLDTLETDIESEADASPISEPAEAGRNLLGIQQQQHQVTEKLISETETNLLPHQDSASTEILINCSICTMQRIAVLEDGNLVELLLEPVKSNVQCDSVYLGVVTKLLPHMGSAFVNIGSSRPSLMGIEHNREPFIFPPFNCNTKEKDVNGSLSSIPEKHLDSSQTELGSSDDNDALVIDEDTEVDFEEDDFEDHEAENDMDVERMTVRNFTSCLVNDNGTGANAGDSVSQLNGKVDQAKAQSHVRGREGTRSSRIAKQMWAQVRQGTKILVQVVKEGLGTKGPTLTAYPKLRSRFWVRMRVSQPMPFSKNVFLY